MARNIHFPSLVMIVRVNGGIIDIIGNVKIFTSRRRNVRNVYLFFFRLEEIRPIVRVTADN